MKECCVDGCKGPRNEETVFFEFPTSRLLRKRWLDAISSQSKVAQDAVICIGHFARGDYELVRGKTRLRSKVVPTVLLGDKLKTNEDTETSQDSTKSDSDRKTDKTITENESTTQNVDKHNGEVHNDNKHTGNSHNDNGKANNESADIGKNVNDKEDKGLTHSDKVDNGNVCNNKEENDRQIANDKDAEKDDKNTQNSENTQSNENTQIDNEKGHKVNSCNDKDDTSDPKMEKNNENGKVNDNSESKKAVQNDNGKIQASRKTRCKITAMRARNRRQDSEDSEDSTDSVSSSPPPPPPPEMENSKEDIEGILTNYYIENKKTERQVAAMTDGLGEEERREEGWRGAEKRDDEWGFEPSEPVFIELSVGQGANTSGPAENDCLMVLESVQCEVDPAALLAAREDMDDDIEKVDLDDDDDEPVVLERKKEDPISLLTSSDEDDVIIQEPKIDTVDVSSADTSEDDMPLVKLLKSSRSSKTPKIPNTVKSKRTKSLLTKLLWGGTDFYCVHCRFTTVSASEYTQHMATHSKVLQLCQDCGFTTCSKAQMCRHKLKHKNERRFKCKRCNYSAKHEMSLVYHMKTHSVTEVELAICDTFEPVSKMSRASGKSKASDSSRTSKSSGEKKYSCSQCVYSTKRRSDLIRHRKRLHRFDSDDDDDEYIP